MKRVYKLTILQPVLIFPFPRVRSLGREPPVLLHPGMHQDAQTPETKSKSQVSQPHSQLLTRLIQAGIITPSRTSSIAIGLGGASAIKAASISCCSLSCLMSSSRPILSITASLPSWTGSSRPNSFKKKEKRRHYMKVKGVSTLYLPYLLQGILQPFSQLDQSIFETFSTFYNLDCRWWITLNQSSYHIDFLFIHLTCLSVSSSLSPLIYEHF